MRVRSLFFLAALTLATLLMMHQSSAAMSYQDCQASCETTYAECGTSKACITIETTCTNTCGEGTAGGGSGGGGGGGGVVNWCGDGICSGTETCGSCQADCGACPGTCGDGVCAPGEICQSDCGYLCDNGILEPGENCHTCPQDAGECPGVCGDGICQSNEDCRSCSADCGQCIPKGNITFIPGSQQGRYKIQYSYDAGMPSRWGNTSIQKNISGSWQPLIDSVLSPNPIAVGIRVLQQIFGPGSGPGRYFIAPTPSSSCGDGVCNGIAWNGSKLSGDETYGTPYSGGNVCAEDCGCGPGQPFALVGNHFVCAQPCQTLTDSVTGWDYQRCQDNHPPGGGYSVNATLGCQRRGLEVPQCYVCDPGSYFNPSTGVCDKFRSGDGVCRIDLGEPVSSPECCGDNVCSAGETATSCWADCKDNYCYPQYASDQQACANAYDYECSNEGKYCAEEQQCFSDAQDAYNSCLAQTSAPASLYTCTKPNTFSNECPTEAPYCTSSGQCVAVATYCGTNPGCDSGVPGFSCSGGQQCNAGTHCCETVPLCSDGQPYGECSGPMDYTCGTKTFTQDCDANGCWIPNPYIQVPPCVPSGGSQV